MAKEESPPPWWIAKRSLAMTYKQFPPPPWRHETEKAAQVLLLQEAAMLGESEEGKKQPYVPVKTGEKR